MSTKIESSVGLKTAAVTAIGQKSAVRKANSEDNSNSASTKAGTDTVSLTGNAVQLQNIHQAVSQSSAFDSKRVEALKAQIADGRYKINDHAIASKLLSADAALGNGSGS
jgi:negative regulator of flagellin synthesis FlgM